MDDITSRITEFQELLKRHTYTLEGNDIATFIPSVPTPTTSFIPFEENKIYMNKNVSNI